MSDNTEINKVEQSDVMKPVSTVEDAGSKIQDDGKKVDTGTKGVEFKKAVEKKTVGGDERLDSSQIIKTDPIHKESLVKKLRSWVVPIVSILILGVITVFVFIPSGTEAIDTLDEIRSINTQIEKNEEKIEDLESINLSQVKSWLTTVTSVIKDDLEVAELAGEVELIARDNDLETKNVQFSRSTSPPSDIPGFVEVITGPFSYEGYFTDISNFLEDLRNESSTVLAIRSVSLTKRSSTGETGTEEEPLWGIDLEIDGFIASQIDSVSLQDPVRVNINEELLNEIEERASIYDGEEE